MFMTGAGLHPSHKVANDTEQLLQCAQFCPKFPRLDGIIDEVQLDAWVGPVWILSITAAAELCK